MGSSRISTPFISAFPDVEEMYPVSIFMVVDLPAPFGPRKPSISPSFTVKVRLSTAFFAPYCFVRF